MSKTYRGAVIGSTKRGGYGHYHDTAFSGLENVKLVAVADDDPQGLAEAGKRLGVTRLYADYREMFANERPELVSIGPQWVTERLAMVEAAAAIGCHIYSEKPLAGDLATADAILDACRKHKVKLSVAHQFRAMPTLRKAMANLAEGKYGKLLRLRARPKDDHRGGGEELIVHGTHLFDLMIALAGTPRWVSAHMAVGERDVTRDDRRAPPEPFGPLAGDSLAATFGFDHGVHGFIDSHAKAARPGRDLYGLLVECEEALLFLRSPGDVWVYGAAQVQPANKDLAWERIWIEDWHFTPEHQPRNMSDWLPRGNTILVRDLIAAIEEDREPLASGQAAHDAIEMIQGVYASHFAEGRRLKFPLEDRKHPLL